MCSGARRRSRARGGGLCPAPGPSPLLEPGELRGAAAMVGATLEPYAVSRAGERQHARGTSHWHAPLLAESEKLSARAVRAMRSVMFSTRRAHWYGPLMLPRASC